MDNGKYYLLIRKLKHSLRERLYRALPDEIIHAPTTDPQAPDEPILNKLGRPYRKAVLKTMKPQEGYAVTDKPQMKHGWLSEDQDYDSNIPLYP